MIRLSAGFHIAGYFLLMLAASMLVPAAVGIGYRDAGLAPLLFAFLSTVIPGAACFFAFPRPTGDLSVREAFVLVVSLWVAVCLFGALPFVFSSHIPLFIDALFESTAGFTTTGSSVLHDIEALPASLQFWRCFTHWLGGIGIVLLGVAVLPMLGGSGHQLYRAQSGMLKSEKIRPRVVETVRALWFVYVSMSLVEFILLMFAGMNWYDAACHTFATVATGGFSPRAASVGAYNNPLIEYIIVFFMVAASINFAVHFQFARQRTLSVFARSAEARFLVLWLLGASLFCTLQLVEAGTYGLEEAWRKSLFMVTSIGSTTGFAVADYNLWPASTQVLMILLMFVGGNAGSTSGGLKSFRILLAMETLSRHLKRMVERRAVVGIRLDGQTVDEETVQSAMQMFLLVFAFYAVCTVSLGFLGCDFLTSISAPAATMFGVGPGLGAVGPAGHFADLPAVAKLLLCFCMLAGRLEFFTVLVLFTPVFWRR
ncbi:MAG: TrkH family potassium uptake protein [Bryobacterales bacterium]|nr:TrkH family potassium uptake protein [Bryobacterales bacterium]